VIVSGFLLFLLSTLLTGETSHLPVIWNSDRL